MGRKFIIEEVEEESKFGCGSIVATIIIALVIGLCGCPVLKKVYSD